MYGQEIVEMNNTIDDIKEQLNDIKRVENSVFALLTMLETFQENMKAQGEIIDSIHENLIQIKDHVLNAESSIENSKKSMMKAQEKLCCIFFIFLFLVLFFMNQVIGTL